MTVKDNSFWLKNKLFRPTAISAYKQALENERKSSEEISALNWLKRKRLVEYAYDSSSFYKNYYRAEKFSPRDLRSPEDWRFVPVLEKHDLKRFGGLILTEGTPANSLIRTTTGGSTGSPVMTYRDRRFPEEILKWRMLRRWGVSPSADMLMLWRIPEQATGNLQRALNYAIWYPTRRHKFDVTVLDLKTLEALFNVLREDRPEILWGYVGALEALALHLESRGYTLDYSPLVWSTAAPLSANQIKLFQRIYGGRILDQYACSEIHWIASNIPGNRRLVVDSDYRHFEISNENMKGEDPAQIGDILLTDLQNYAFPLIRYRNGDRGRLASSPDGSMLPFDCIDPVRGRISEMIRSPDGSVLSGEYLTTVFDDCVDLVQQFQFYQKKDYSVQIYINLSIDGCRSVERTREVMARKKLELSEKLNNQVLFQVCYVEKIEADRGKTRFIQSELNQGM